jgi:YD repeat-containing protein
VSEAAWGLQTSPGRSGPAVAVLTDALNQATTLSLDGLGQLTSRTTPDGAVERWERDSHGQMVAYIDPLTRVTNYAYDYSATGAGDLTLVTYPDASTNQYQYEHTFHHPTVSVDGNGNRTTMAYDLNAGDLLSVTTAPNATATATTVYTYYQSGGQSIGLLHSVTDPNNHTTTYLFDTGTRRLAAVEDALTHYTSYAYDAAGNQTTVADALGHVTSYAYDGMRRVTQQTAADGGISTTTYDARW